MLSLEGTASAAPGVYRCEVNGIASFQSFPCTQVRPAAGPGSERINADEKRGSGATGARARQPPPPQTVSPEPSPLPRTKEPTYRCDGREYCSQMRSCAEAMYFLENCPDVKMDGDRNGVPCERQWCK
ncbi:MAG: excalibur calcium-binding domain-containing protein [Methylotetracoccus sp.]